MASETELARRRDDALDILIEELEARSADQELVERLKETKLPARDPEYNKVEQLQLLAEISQGLPKKPGPKPSQDKSNGDSNG